MKHAITLSIAVALALGVTAGASHAPELKPGGSVPAAQTSDDVVVQWNEIAVTSIGAQPPFPSGRFMAIVQLAVFEAVNAISGKYEPYLGTVTAPAGASTEAAAITAAHGVLKTFPGAPATLDQQRDASLALIPDGQAKTDGITVGEAAAAAMIAERTGDGSTPAQFYLPTNSDPYQWQLTTPSCSPAGGAFVHWANVSPFGVLHSAQFRADPPPALASEEYANDFREVQALGDINSPNRTPQNTNVARIYGAQPPHVGWNSVARQIIAMRDDEITDTARVLALMNMSLADGHISVFESKYFYRTWRPQTAIPRADEDGNAGTTPGAFTPLINTPCFPGYPSAHGVGAGAASRILWKEYGRFHTITNSHPSVPGVVLNYSDLLDIVKAVSDARVNGGIHFRSDQDGAERQGKAIAQWNLDNRLRPR